MVFLDVSTVIAEISHVPSCQHEQNELVKESAMHAWKCVTFMIVGFTKREESEYDPFGAGHSSTSISAGLGMAVGRDTKGKNNQILNPNEQNGVRATP
eukprot:1152316-Pelagomonas_calceolata.AAC.13